MLHPKSSLRELFQSYKGIFDYYTTNGNAIVPRLHRKFIPYTSEVSAKSDAIILFIIAHELAHIFAGHLNCAEVKNVRMENNTITEFYQVSQEMEFEADSIAWEWYEQAWDTVLPEDPGFFGPLDKMVAKDEAAALYFFVLLTLVERTLPIPDRYSTHPPATQRLERLVAQHKPKSGRTVLNWAMNMPTLDEIAKYTK